VDGQADAGDDSSGVTVEAAPDGTLEGRAEDPPESIATDDARAHHDVTTAAGQNEEPVTDSPPAEDLASDSAPNEPVASDSAPSEQLAADSTGSQLGAGDVETGGEATAESLPAESPVAESVSPEPLPRQVGRVMAGRRRGGKGRRLARPDDEPSRRTHTPEERLLLLDTWQRSGLPAKDFSALVGVSKHTLYKWRQQFERLGPGGLMDQPRGGPRGSRLPELTKRTILMIKASHPEWGCQRISDMLLRGPALAASASAVARVLHEAGYQRIEEPTHPHPDKVRRFERARPNQLWQTDLFTFVLKRQNRRVYLVAFMDDQSRFITGYGLHASQSSALVLEVLRAGIASYGTPEEILTDNGSQYITWRGKGAFTKELEKRGIRQIVAQPRRPQTLGKIERFWGTLWRECIETAVFLDLGDARQRIGLFIDHYNFQRPHRGVGGLVPADRFFGAAPEVLKTLRQRVAANSLELARHGVPKQPFYLTGQLDGQPFSVHRAGDRIVLRRAEGSTEEVELVPPPEEKLCQTSAAGGDGESRDPQPPKQELPRPVCPDGSPSPMGQATDAETSLPGTSALDESLAPPAEATDDAARRASRDVGHQPSQADRRDAEEAGRRPEEGGDA
jgi:transposase InsO family protein